MELAVKGEMLGWQSLSEILPGLSHAVILKGVVHSLTSDGQLHALFSGVKFMSELLSFAVSAIFSLVRACNLLDIMTTVQSQFSESQLFEVRFNQGLFCVQSRIY